MRIFIDFDVKEFDDQKAADALSSCENLCSGCENSLEKCLLNTVDCPVKNAIEALRGMIRTGKGIKRYKELGSL